MLYRIIKNKIHCDFKPGQSRRLQSYNRVHVYLTGKHWRETSVFRFWVVISVLFLKIKFVFFNAWIYPSGFHIGTPILITLIVKRTGLQAFKGGDRIYFFGLVETILKTQKIEKEKCQFFSVLAYNQGLFIFLTTAHSCFAFKVRRRYIWNVW